MRLLGPGPAALTLKKRPRGEAVAAARGKCVQQLRVAAQTIREDGGFGGASLPLVGETVAKALKDFFEWAKSQAKEGTLAKCAQYQQSLKIQ